MSNQNTNDSINRFSAPEDTDIGGAPGPTTKVWPVLIAARDENGLVRIIQCDANGLLTIVPVGTQNVIISGVSGGNFPLPTATVTTTFTTATTGSPTTPISALKYWSVVVVPTGGVTSWGLSLQVAYSGTNYQDFLYMSSGEATNGGTVAKTAPFGYVGVLAASASFRLRCTSIVLGGGTNIVATAVGVS